MKIWSRVCGTILIIINLLYFLPITLEVIKSGGGGFGYGMILLPITIVSHLFIAPAVTTWIKKKENHSGLLIVNSIGLTWTIFWFAIFSLTPTI